MRNTMPSARRRRSSSTSTRTRDAVGLLGVAVVDEEHVDVARVVQLVAAELAHADDRERDRPVARARAPRRGTPRRAPASSRPTAAGRRGRAGRAARCAGYSRRFHAAERARAVVVRRPRSRRARRERTSAACSRSRSPRSSRATSSSAGSCTIAFVSDRDAQRSGDDRPREALVARRARRRASGRPRRGASSAARAAGAASARRGRCVGDRPDVSSASVVSTEDSVADRAYP